MRFMRQKYASDQDCPHSSEAAYLGKSKPAPKNQEYYKLRTQIARRPPEDLLCQGFRLIASPHRFFVVVVRNVLAFGHYLLTAGHDFVGKKTARAKA